MSDAKFTEYLADYLADNELPDEFNQIDGFDQLFVARYVDREIGFETENLFRIKLSLRASMVIPIYKQRIDQITNAIANIPTSQKTITESYSDSGSSDYEYGEQHSTLTELPLNETSALPNSEQSSDATHNTSSYSNERNTTRIEKGLTTLENYELIARLQSDIYNIKEKLLNEFESLFMGVF